jgi:hypothetical protein
MTVNDHRLAELGVDANGRVHGNHHRGIDHRAVERAAANLLRALGADGEALEETPRRVADAYVELLTQPFRATTFPNDDGYDELIVARSIPFHSLCMHHLLPFHGVAHIGYLPGERIKAVAELASEVPTEAVFDEGGCAGARVGGRAARPARRGLAQLRSAARRPAGQRVGAADAHRARSAHGYPARSIGSSPSVETQSTPSICAMARATLETTRLQLAAME